MSAVHMNSRGLRPRIEEMIARGASNLKTAEATGASINYVEKIAAQLRFNGAAPVSREDDEAHYSVILAKGGFPVLDLPRPAIRLFHDGEKMRRAYG